MLKILNLLDFTPLTYTVFCTLPPQVQNPAMYLVCFIIACNVHFLSQDITFFFFFYEMTCAFHVTKSKMIIFLISESKRVISFLNLKP